MNKHVHWLGCGLSAKPGILALIEAGVAITVWNRSSEQEFATRTLDWRQLAETVNPGDIIVSMLPAHMHEQVLKFCLEFQCHFLSTSYINATMRELASDKLSFIGEAGLDPGLDHLLAYRLVDEAYSAITFEGNNKYKLKSYCGGFPSVMNEIYYKFSWSPLGVLRSLQREAAYLKNSKSVHCTNAIAELWQETINGEAFEIYPNGNSIQYIDEYFSNKIAVSDFVRATIRPAGWQDAWTSIRAKAATANEDELEVIANELWQKYSYRPLESDRVLLFVQLQSDQGWQRSYQINQIGNNKHSAMAQLVSLPLSFVVLDALADKLRTGWQTIEYLRNDSNRLFQYLKQHEIEIQYQC